MAIHWIETEWPSAIGVVGDRASYNRFMRKQQGRAFHPFPSIPLGGHCEWMTHAAEGRSVILIAIGPSKDKAEMVYSIVHECVHAVDFIFEHAGEKNPGIETRAYLTEHLVRECCRHLSYG